MRRVGVYKIPEGQFAIGCCVALLLFAMTMGSCSSNTTGPLAIRMYNPKTNQTLHCTARSENAAHSEVLASAVEACAQQLEASGFVRDN